MFSQGQVYPHLPERLSLLATGPDGQLCSGAPAGTTSVCGRRTLNTEKKANVVVAAWGAELFNSLPR